MTEAAKPERRPPPVIGIVDDDDDVRHSLGELVETLGYRGEVFETADALLGWDGTGGLACVVTDLQMPGTNGVQLAQRLNGSGVPVILITAFPTPVIEQQAREAGVIHFLRKPFDAIGLIEALASILEGR